MSTTTAITLRDDPAARQALRKQLADRAASTIYGYDVLREGQRHLRPRPTVEYAEPDKLFPAYQRLQAIAFAREMQRANPLARSILTQMGLHVVGPGPKVIFHGPQEAADSEAWQTWTKAAATWYNSRWARRADARGSLHLGEMTKLAYVAAKRDGDVLLWFDDTGITGGNDLGGRLWWFEADQLVELSEADFAKRFARGGWTQNQGVVQDKWGRVLFYLVTPKRGVSTVDSKDVTALPAGQCRLLAARDRLTQIRGFSEILTAAADLLDIRDMGQAELQTARVAARQAAVWKMRDADLMAVSRGTQSDRTVDSTLQTRARSLEQVFGPNFHYLFPEESFDIVDSKRPNLATNEFYSFFANIAGGSMGLPKMITMLRAEASYSAAKAELNLFDAWVAAEQKWLERSLCDWIVGKAVTWAVDNGDLAAPPTGEWNHSFAWPQLAKLDEQKEGQATDAALAAGRTNLEQVLGPTWRENIDKMAEVAAYAKSKGVTLTFGTAGASAAPAQPAATPDEMPMDNPNHDMGAANAGQ